MTNPMDPAPTRRDWILIVAVVLVAASTVIASFTAQSGLGVLAGWTAFVSAGHVDLHLSWLLPLTVDAYGVGATRIATNKRRYTAEVRRQAFGHALAAVAVSVVANAVFHLIEAHVIVLGATAWLLVVAVSIVPPVALGGLAHLLSVAARDEVMAVAVPVSTVVEEDRPAPVEVRVPAVPEPLVATAGIDAGRVNTTPAPIPATVETPSKLDGVTHAVPAPSAGVPPQLSDDARTTTSYDDEVAGEAVSGSQVQPEPVAESDAPFYPLALSHFLSDVAQGELPPVRTIKDQMSVGTDRARRLQTYLGQLVEVTR